MNNAGLPGTGLGGLMYIVLALAMPFFELLQTVRGRSSLARWKLVLRQTAIALGVVVAVVITAWALMKLAVAPSPYAVHGDWVLMALLVAFPALLLATLVTVLRIWAWVVRRSEPPRTEVFSDECVPHEVN